MAVKNVTIEKNIDADFAYDGSTYTGIAMQVIVDSSSWGDTWTNDIKLLIKPIAKGSHSSVIAKTLFFNFKRITRVFRISGYLCNTKITTIHSAAGASDTVLTNSSADFLAAGVCKGMTLSNTTDGSTGTITAVTATTITVDDLTGGTGNNFEQNDVCTVTQTANVKAQLLRRMSWDGNAGSSAYLSVPGSDSDLPPSQSLQGVIRNLEVNKIGDLPYSEMDSKGEGIKIYDVSFEFIVGDAA
jgi:hypothetical protein